MKLIIDIPEEQYNDIVKHLTDNDGNYAYSDFNLREIIRNGTPYNPSGDAISRSALREAVEITQYNDIDDLTRTEKLIDNAQAVPQVTVFTESTDEKAVADLKMELQNVLDSERPQGEKPKLTDEQIEQIIDLLETEWGYEGIREDVSRILKGGTE